MDVFMMTRMKALEAKSLFKVSRDMRVFGDEKALPE